MIDNLSKRVIFSRTNIYLCDKHVEKLKFIAEEQGVKFSELVRKIMAEYIEKQEEKSKNQ